MERIDLDLRTVDLYGWERGKCLEKVCSLVKGIIMGDEFPLVPIRRDENIFVLSNITDGGHHRAVAHYLVGEPLRCLVNDEEHWQIMSREKVHVADIELYTRPFVWNKFRRRFPNYRPIGDISEIKDFSRINGVSARLLKQ